MQRRGEHHVGGAQADGDGEGDGEADGVAEDGLGQQRAPQRRHLDLGAGDEEQEAEGEEGQDVERFVDRDPAEHVGPDDDAEGELDDDARHLHLRDGGGDQRSDDGDRAHRHHVGERQVRQARDVAVRRRPVESTERHVDHACRIQGAGRSTARVRRRRRRRLRRWETGRRPSAGTVPSRPAWKSSTAVTSSARVFMTNGP